MKIKNIFISAFVLCATIYALNAFGTMLTPVSTTPSDDASISATDPSKQSAELSKTAPEISKPTMDIINDRTENSKPVPEFQRPLRELSPMPVSEKTNENKSQRELKNATYMKQK